MRKISFEVGLPKPGNSRQGTNHTWAGGGGWGMTPPPKKIFFVDSRSKLTRGGYDPWELFDPWVKNILTPG